VNAGVRHSMPVTLMTSDPVPAVRPLVALQICRARNKAYQRACLYMSITFELGSEKRAGSTFQFPDVQGIVQKDDVQVFAVVPAP